MIKRYFIALVGVIAMVGNLNAQKLWTSAEASTNIVGGLKGFAQVEFRTHDGLSSAERWAGTIGLEYSVCKYLKVTAGYMYMHQQTETSHSADAVVPSYWLPKHRGLVALTGSYGWNGFTFSLRERYQDTYNGRKSVPRYEADGITRMADKVVDTKHKHTLRSRLEVKYKIASSGFSPYVSCELHNYLTEGMELEETRWTFGTSYSINKKNSVELYYRFIDETSKEDAHIIGLGYKIKI